MKYLFCLLFFVLLSTTLLAGTRDPSTSDNEYIKYGSDFHYISKICGIYNDESPYCASGVIIDKNWVLTAAHVVYNAKICKINLNNKEYLADKIILHDKFNKTFGFADIAMLYSKTDLVLDFYPELYSDNNEIGMVCSISGYGITGSFNTGGIISDSQRRAGSNVIDKIEKELLICSIGGPKKTSLEYLICNGDSGGGLFIGNKLAGINSCVLASDGKADSTYGDESGHTRISLYYTWIKQILKEEK